MEPARMVAMDDARPDVMISWKRAFPRREAATPRTAEETMCVIGEVTLMERRLAMLMRKPKTPVIREPQMKVVKTLDSPSSSNTSALPEKSSII